MTLIITWRNAYGMAMFADSRLTKKGVGENRYEDRRLKLLPISYLDAGVSFYGEGKINGRDTTGRWIKRFIDTNKGKINTITEFSEKLLEKLNEEIGTLTIETGFHLSGFSEIGDRSTAIFHHLTNKKKNDYFDRELRDDFYDAGTGMEQEFRIGDIVRNGDYFIFNVFAENASKILDPIIESCRSISSEFCKRSELDITPPFNPDFKGLKDAMLILLEIIKKIYDMFSNTNPGKFPPVVGGEITYLLISREDIEEYYDGGLQVD